MNEAAKKAMLNANPFTGRLPRGTPADVIVGLRALGFVSKVGLTWKGRQVREALMTESLAAFDA